MWLNTKKVRLIGFIKANFDRSTESRKTSFYRGPVCRLANKKLSGAGVPQREKKKLSLERMTCLADKTNHPVERLSLNRSQCGSCSTKYAASAGT